MKTLKKFIEEFKTFIAKGNVLDMAVGVIIATAFGKITTSLVNDVFMPFIGWIIGDVDLADLNIVLSPAVLNEAGEEIKPAVVVAIGTGDASQHPLVSFFEPRVVSVRDLVWFWYPAHVVPPSEGFGVTLCYAVTPKSLYPYIYIYLSFYIFVIRERSVTA